MVEGTFIVPSRRLFVVHGQIVEGAVRTGQLVVQPVGLAAPVHAVESVLLAASTGRANPALGFEYRDEGELSQWQALELQGETLELTG